jgi:hypothetical protein
MGATLIPTLTSRAKPRDLELDRHTKQDIGRVSFLASIRDSVDFIEPD